MAQCPHCNQAVTILPKGDTNGAKPVLRESSGRMKKEIMYSCPQCGKVLGFGFFLGGWLTGRP